MATGIEQIHNDDSLFLGYKIINTPLAHTHSATSRKLLYLGQTDIYSTERTLPDTSLDQGFPHRGDKDANEAYMSLPRELGEYFDEIQTIGFRHGEDVTRYYLNPRNPVTLTSIGLDIANYLVLNGQGENRHLHILAQGGGASLLYAIIGELNRLRKTGERVPKIDTISLLNPYSHRGVLRNTLVALNLLEKSGQGSNNHGVNFALKRTIRGFFGDDKDEIDHIRAYRETPARFGSRVIAFFSSIGGATTLLFGDNRQTPPSFKEQISADSGLTSSLLYGIKTGFQSTQVTQAELETRIINEVTLQNARVQVLYGENNRLCNEAMALEIAQQLAPGQKDNVRSIPNLYQLLPYDKKQGFEISRKIAADIATAVAGFALIN